MTISRVFVRSDRDDADIIARIQDMTNARVISISRVGEGVVTLVLKENLPTFVCGLCGCEYPEFQRFEDTNNCVGCEVYDKPEDEDM